MASTLHSSASGRDGPRMSLAGINETHCSCLQTHTDGRLNRRPEDLEEEDSEAEDDIVRVMLDPFPTAPE